MVDRRPRRATGRAGARIRAESSVGNLSLGVYSHPAMVSGQLKFIQILLDTMGEKTRKCEVSEGEG